MPQCFSNPKEMYHSWQQNLRILIWGCSVNTRTNVTEKKHNCWIKLIEKPPNKPLFSFRWGFRWFRFVLIEQSLLQKSFIWAQRVTNYSKTVAYELASPTNFHLRLAPSDSMILVNLGSILKQKKQWLNSRKYFILNRQSLRLGFPNCSLRANM